MRRFTFALIFLLYPGFLPAADISVETLTGKWTFTHMLLDGETKRPVNLLMEFLADGQVINYDRAGKEKSRATYTVENAEILYSDKRGKQAWKVLEFDGQTLHVDHQGAEMFFERQ